MLNLEILLLLGNKQIKNVNLNSNQTHSPLL